MRIHLFSVMFLSSLMLLAANEKEYPAYRVLRAPQIDGQLTDHAWRRLPEGRGFRLLDKNNSFVLDRTTRFKIGYDDAFLYLAVDCTEPDLKNIRAVETYRDGWVFDDAIELFFQPGEGAPYVQLLCNANGARWAKRQGAEREIEPPAAWLAAAGRSDTGWTLETAIPLDLLNCRDIGQLRFNIARNVPAEKKDKHQCWAKVRHGFNDTGSFAVLRKQASNGPADIELEGSEINHEYDRFLFSRLNDIARGGKGWKEVEARYSAAPGFEKVRAMQEQLAKNCAQLAASAYDRTYAEWLKIVATVNTRSRTLSFKIDAQGLSDAEFLVNGVPVAAENGSFSFIIQEGVTAIAFSAKAADNASLKFICPEFPELERRWAFAENISGKDWTLPTFNDLAWKPLPEKIPAGNLYFRQLVLWNQKHDGQFRCLNPSVFCWNFSLDSVETVYLSLYSPTGLPVNSYEFTFTLPPGFRLLDMEEGARRNRLSLAPEKVVAEENAAGATQYRLIYKARDIHEWKTADSILGIFKDADGTPGDQGQIPYARLINHNLTEIGGSLPYALLPPIRGRRLKKMLMSFYKGDMPQALSRELTDAVLKDSIRSGMDTFITYPIAGMVPDSVRKHDGKLIMGYLNHPIWGSKLINGKVTDLFREHPELFCLYYTGERKTDLDPSIAPHKQQIQFCPSLVNGKYQQEFYQAVLGDYREFFFKNYPQAEYVFLNWEQEPWTGNIYTRSTNPSGAFCFCPLCKEKFREYAKLPPDADLSNENLFKNYYEQWRSFRYSQDAATHAIVIKALQDLGKKAYFYSWSNHFGYWEAAKNIPFDVFLGCPGNGTADGRQQWKMDEYMKFHQGKLGRKNMAGQRFIFFPQTNRWDTEKVEGWLKFSVMSEDGYIHPETWKWQLIRILATMQGGCDLQNPLEMVSGCKYYIGEATRMVARYENIFYDGQRHDALAVSEQIAYPDLLVLTRKNERLVLLFNESDEPKTVTVRNLSLTGEEVAQAFYAGTRLPQAGEFSITIPANDVEVVHIELVFIE